MLLVVDSFRCTCMYMHYRVSRSPVLLACDNCGLLWIFWWIKKKFLPCGELYLDQVRTIMEGVVDLNCGIWSDDPLSASVSSHPTIVCKFLYPALPITREYDVDAWKGEDYDTIKAYISLVCDVGKTSTLYRSPFTRPNHPTPHSLSPTMTWFHILRLLTQNHVMFWRYYLSKFAKHHSTQKG